MNIQTGKGSTTVFLKPGQFVFGRGSAARELKKSPSTIRNYLTILQSWGNLDIHVDNHYSIITVVNWESYQIDLENRTGIGQAIIQKQDRQPDTQKTVGKPPIEPPKDHQKTAEGQATGHPKNQNQDTNNKVKKKYISTEPEKSSGSMLPISFNFLSGEFENVTTQDLEGWGEAYPAVEIKGEIRRAAQWMKANPRKKKKNWPRFITNWLARAQEKGGTFGYIGKEEENLEKF